METATTKEVETTEVTKTTKKITTEEILKIKDFNK
jgi:hypothetical protein